MNLNIYHTLYHIMPRFSVYPRSEPFNILTNECDNLDDHIKLQYREYDRDTGISGVFRRGNKSEPYGIFPSESNYMKVIDPRTLVYINHEPKPYPSQLTLFQVILVQEHLPEWCTMITKPIKLFSVNAVDNYDEYLGFCKEFYDHDNAFYRLGFHPWTRYNHVIFTKLQTIPSSQYHEKVAERTDYLNELLKKIGKTEFIKKFKHPTKTVCQCGGIYTHNNKAHHIKTEGHISFMTMKEYVSNTKVDMEFIDEYLQANPS